jgi:adenosylcobinamide-GDP ribazoletransferase
MTVLRSLVLALSLFSRLPLPTLSFEKTTMRYVLAALPSVGLVLALLLYGWFELGVFLSLSPLLLAAGLTLIPVALTGGIHLDGFCDTVDALSSRAPMERKQEILKDPHVGAFAVIGIAAYILLYFALCAELTLSPAVVLSLGAAAVLSRAAGGFASLVFPSARKTGLLSTLADAADKKDTRGRFSCVLSCVLWFVLASLVLGIFDWRCALAIVAVALLVLLYVRLMSKRQFGGMSGDLAGFTIQLIELGAVAALVAVEKVMVVL